MEYCFSLDEVDWETAEDRETAIAMATAALDELREEAEANGIPEDRNGFWIAQCRYPDPAQYVDAELLIDAVRNGEDFVDLEEVADDFLDDVPKEAADELTDELRRVFGAWLDRHNLRSSGYFAVHPVPYSRQPDGIFAPESRKSA